MNRPRVQHPLLNIVNNALIDLPSPYNIKTWWNFGYGDGFLTTACKNFKEVENYIRRQGEKFSAEPTWSSGQGAVGLELRQELVSPPHYCKSFCRSPWIHGHGWQHTSFTSVVGLVEYFLPLVGTMQRAELRI